MNSRAKGKRGELEAAKELRESFGIPGAQRGARNGVRAGQDVMGVPGLRIEVKRRGRLQAARFMDQAIAERGDGELPLVMLREDGGPWMFLMLAAHLPVVAERIRHARGE